MLISNNIMLISNNQISYTKCRKKTHTDQYYQEEQKTPVITNTDHLRSNAYQCATKVRLQNQKHIPKTKKRYARMETNENQRIYVYLPFIAGRREHHHKIQYGQEDMTITLTKLSSR